MNYFTFRLIIYHLLLNHITKSQVIGFVIGGNPAPLGNYQFIVRLYLYASKNSLKQFHCAGSIIHGYWILTAAHCLYSDLGKRIKYKPEQLIVVTNYRNKVIRPYSNRTHRVDSFISHEDFNLSNNFYGDLALIKLVDRIDLASESADIITLVPKNYSLVNVQTDLAGWSKSDLVYRETSWYLNEISFTVSDTDCANYTQHLSPDHLLCYKSSVARASHYDYGGPVVMLSENGRILVGVISLSKTTGPLAGLTWATKLSYPEYGQWIRTIVGLI